MGDIRLRPKPAYGEACNNCGLCCIAVQCPLSLSVFGEHEICPALGMADEGNFGCRLVQEPQTFIPEIQDGMVPLMQEYHALLIGAGAGCDGTLEDEEPTPSQRQSIRSKAAVMRETATPEALALFHYVTESRP